MPDTTDLDHIALAASDTTPLLHLLTGTFGAITLDGGHSVGFRPMQVLVGDVDRGMKIELLEPWQPERNDFLERFLARHGAGPHHMTFKVPDIRAAIDRARAAGYEPVNIDLSDPRWQEAFLHPRQSHGTVIQLAESHGYHASRAALLAWVAEHGASGEPTWWVDPLPASGPSLSLERVVVAVPDLAAPRAMYEQLLDGICVDASDAHCEFRWPGGGRVRLIADAGVPARVDHLEVDGLPEPITILGTTFTPVA